MQARGGEDRTRAARCSPEEREEREGRAAGVSLLDVELDGEEQDPEDHGEDYFRGHPFT